MRPTPCRSRPANRYSSYLSNPNVLMNESKGRAEKRHGLYEIKRAVKYGKRLPSSSTDRLNKASPFNRMENDQVLMPQWLPYITAPRTWLQVLAAGTLLILITLWHPDRLASWPMAETLHHLSLVCLLYLLGRLFLLRHLAFGAAVLIYGLPLLLMAAPLGHFTYPFAASFG